MKEITPAQMEAWIESGHLTPSYKLKEGNKWYQYAVAGAVAPGEVDRLYRTQVTG